MSCSGGTRSGRLWRQERSRNQVKPFTHTWLNGNFAVFCPCGIQHSDLAIASDYESKFDALCLEPSKFANGWPFGTDRTAAVRIRSLPIDMLLLNAATKSEQILVAGQRRYCACVPNSFQGDDLR